MVIKEEDFLKWDGKFDMYYEKGYINNIVATGSASTIEEAKAEAVELTHQISNNWNKTNIYKDNDFSYVSPDYRPYREEPVYWYEPISVQLAAELEAELEHNGNAYGHYKNKAQGLAVGHN